MKANKITAVIMSLSIALAAASCGNTDSSAGDIPAAGSRSSVSAAAPGTADEPAATSAPAASSAPAETGSNVTFPDETEPDIIKSIDPGFKTAANSFAADLFRNAAVNDIKAGKNTMVSPESVMLALGLAANGADGSTLEQFENVLGGGMKLEDIDRDLGILLDTAGNDTGVEFGIANSVWMRDSFGLIKPDYIRTCEDVLKAESFSEPFDSSTVEKINGWVNDKTKGMIPGVVDRISPNTYLFLINCIAFEGKWAKGYDENMIREGEFTNAEGVKEKCTMLCSSESFYIHDDKASGFVKNYMGGRFSFAAILPNEGVSAAEYAEGMTGESLISLFGSLTTQYDVVAVMPEFKFDWDSEISDQLKAMGLDKAFSADADLSKMFEPADGPTYLDKVIHKTHIELDREGTKAAAVTSIDVKCDAIAEQAEVILDRPFIFAIYDNINEIPVFLGAVNSVAEK